MLIKKGYSEGDIVCFKIVNGDEVVAKIISVTDEGYEVSKPCTVIPSNQGLGLMQSLMCGDINNNIVLRKDHVLMHGPVIQDIENHYIRTTTGIEPVTGKLIV
jgi:hypothetical protein